MLIKQHTISFPLDHPISCKLECVKDMSWTCRYAVRSILDTLQITGYTARSGKESFTSSPSLKKIEAMPKYKVCDKEIPPMGEGIGERNFA